MATDIIMPQLGESIAEGTIIKWLIRPGGRIEKDEPLLEVETDKVSLEIPSPSTGFLTEVLIAEGQTVPIGTLLARLDTDPPAEGVVNRVGGVVVRSIGTRPPQARQDAPSSQVDPSPAGEDHYSPAVKQLAKEHDVDLGQVTGTGAGGRVTKKDILEFIGTRTAPPSPAARPSPSTASAAPEQLLPLTPMRKTIAERMVKSRHTSAHVVTFFEADFGTIAKVREGRGLTYLPFIIHAVAGALREEPLLNSSWSDAGIILKRDINIGVAVALDEGLLVPVVRNAVGKTVTQLAKEAADLAERARAKRLNPEEVQDGTFTITNHGGFGSLFSTPIIHQPQIAIMGVGAVQKRATVINDAIAIRPMAYLSLSFDHRVIDGATADRFMAKVKTNVERHDWEKLL